MDRVMTAESRGPRVRYVAAQQFNKDQWQLYFDVTTPNCSASTGGFTYRVVVENADGSSFSIERESATWTPADGAQFRMEEVVVLGEEQVVRGVNSVRISSYACSTREDDRGLSSRPDTVPSDRYPEATIKVAGFVDVLFQLAYTYAVFKNSNGDIEKVLAGIGEQFLKVSEKLSSLLNEIASVKEAIARLPAIIQKAIQKEFFDDALAEARSASDLLRVYTRPEEIGNRIPEIDALLKILHEKIYRIIGDGSSFDRLLAAAPFVSTWVSAGVACEKLKARNHDYRITSPWTYPLMQDYEAHVRRMIDLADITDRDYTKNLIPLFPPRRKNLANGNRFFVTLTRNEPEINDLIIYPKSGNDPEYIAMYRHCRDTDPNQFGCFIFSPKFHKVADPLLTDTEVQAKARFVDLTESEQALANFYAIFRRISSERQSLFDFFVEPKNIWEQ